MRGGIGRRRGVQTIVIALVLVVSTASSVLGLALVVDSHATFDHAFSAQRGAHVVATVDASRATSAQLAATDPPSAGERGDRTARRGERDRHRFVSGRARGRPAAAHAGGAHDARRPGRRHHARGRPLAAAHRSGRDGGQHRWVRGRDRRHRDRDQRAGEAAAHRRRSRHIGLALGRRLGRPGPSPGAALAGHAGHRGDALPLPQRRHRRLGECGYSGRDQGAAGWGCDRHTVLSRRPGRAT